MDYNRVEQWDSLAVYTQARTNELAAPLLDLLVAINKRLDIDVSNGGLQTSGELNLQELYNLAIKIPIECAFLQTMINDYASGHAISSIICDNVVTGQLDEERKKPGDARERLRRAEKVMEDELLIVEARRQIAVSLQAIVQRADKVYEGIKKAVDASIRVAWFDGKAA